MFRSVVFAVLFGLGLCAVAQEKNAVSGNGAPTENPRVVPAKAAQPKTRAVTPVVEGYGAVVAIPDANELPEKGSKVVIDSAGMGKDPAQPLPGLVRAVTPPRR